MTNDWEIKLRNYLDLDALSAEYERLIKLIDYAKLSEEQKKQAERERLAQENARRQQEQRKQERLELESQRGKRIENTTNGNFSSSTLPSSSSLFKEKKATNQAETMSKDHQTSTNFANSAPTDAENATVSSAPGGGYSGGGTIGGEKFIAPDSPSSIIQKILNEAKEAIKSKAIPKLETAEKKITSLFEKGGEKQAYYSWRPELEEKLEKVIQTKTIQEIQVYHLDVAQEIEKTIEPFKIQGKEWKEVISSIPIEKIPNFKKQIENDILRQTKKEAINKTETDLKLARFIKPDIQPGTRKKVNWKIIIENVSSEKEVKKELEENRQTILSQAQEAAIDNLNSLLGQELKMEDLDGSFSQFPLEIRQKQLTALKAYHHQVAEHIAEKKRNYSSSPATSALDIQQKEKAGWKELILPSLALGGVGVIGGIFAINHWFKDASKLKVNKKAMGGVNPDSFKLKKLKNQLNQYFTDLKKLQKSDWNPELVKKLNEDLKQIQQLTEQLEKTKKTKFEEQKWNDFQTKYKSYLKGESRNN